MSIFYAMVLASEVEHKTAGPVTFSSQFLTDAFQEKARFTHVNLSESYVYKYICKITLLPFYGR